jgi:subtilisin family serine protease
MIEIAHRPLPPGGEASANGPETAESAPAANDADAAASAAPVAPGGDLRATFEALFGLPRAMPSGIDAASLLVPLKTGPSDPTKPATSAHANPTDRQRAQDALKAGSAPPVSHPRMLHVRDVHEQLRKEGLPTDAGGVRVYVVGDTPDHGAMVVRTIAGPAGLAQRAEVELPEKMPDVNTGRLSDEEALDHTLANLSVKTGQATSEQLRTWAVDSLEAAYMQPKAELDYLVAHAPKDGQTKIVNMSWGMSEDALVAQATKAALDNPDSPLVAELNARHQALGKPALDLSRPGAKEELRHFIAGLIHQAISSPDGTQRLLAARKEAIASVAKAREAGFLPIAAAGNFFEARRTGERSQTNENLVATIPGVLSVGSVALGDATRKGDAAMGEDSSTGAAIAAPGVDVPVGIDKKTRGTIDVSGTSFASPYAASVAALMIKANPNITPAQIERILQSDAVTTDVKGTTRDGAGVIDPVAAVRAAKALLHAADPGLPKSQGLDMAAKRAAYDTLRQLLPATSPVYKAVVRLINDDHFVALDVATQKNLLAGIVDRRTDPTLVKDVTALAASREFNELGPAARARFAQNFVGLEPSDRAAAMALLQRPDILKLPLPIKDALTAAAAKAPSDTTSIDALVKRANDPAFRKLPADAQAAFFRAFEYQHDFIEMDPAATNKQNLLKLVDSAAFGRLDATAQSRWMLALGSADPDVRTRTHARLAEVLDKTAKLPDAAKAAALDSRAGALDADDKVRSDRKELPGASKETPQISAAQADRRSVFFSADGKGIDPRKADVLVHTVTIEGQRIEVVYPRPMPTDVPSIDLIAKGLAGLPATERAHVAQVIVDPRLKDFMQAASAKDGRPNRIFMGNEAPDNQRDMSAILSHEAAHLLAADQFKAHPALLKKWEAAIKADNHRVSDYATTSLQEDVAETIALYYQVKGTPDEAVMKRDFPNRYAAVRELLGEK